MPLHPFIADLFDKMAQAGKPALSAGSPIDARALTRTSRAALGDGPEMLRVEELMVPTRSGHIAARLYVPVELVVGLIVYVHGGGWVVGEPDDFDAMARTLAQRSRCALLLPDYRLAPENPFPAGLEDVEDTLVWTAAHVSMLVGSAVSIVAAGDSAGGNLVAVATHLLAGQVQLAGQVLIYPVTDCDMTRPSYRDFSQGMQLTRADMVWFFEHYAPNVLHADPRISPLRQPARIDIPPTLVVTAEYDVLRDEGEAYARALGDAGAIVTTRRIDGLPHGFIRMHNLVDTADVALSAIAMDIATLCAPRDSEPIDQ